MQQLSIQVYPETSDLIVYLRQKSKFLIIAGGDTQANTASLPQPAIALVDQRNAETQMHYHYPPHVQLVINVLTAGQTVPSADTSLQPNIILNADGQNLKKLLLVLADICQKFLQPMTETRQANGTQHASYIFVPQKTSWHRINLKDIVYVEADGSYAIIHTPTHNILVTGNLKALEHQLPRNQFIRISRKYLINLTCITLIHTDELEVVVGDKKRSFTISSEMRHKLLKILPVLLLKINDADRTEIV